mgnify:FL=1|tara:strand:+ start:59 stop:379 length:321 start_codon:yes stop_codon:yes gene_type:complete
MVASRTTILKAQKIVNSNGVRKYSVALTEGRLMGDTEWEVRDTSTNRVSVDGGGYVCYKEPYASNDLCMGWKLGNKGVTIEDRTCKHIEAVKMFQLLTEHGRRDLR